MAGSWGMLRGWGFQAADGDPRDHADRRLEPAREPRLPGRRALPPQGRTAARRPSSALPRSSASSCSGSSWPCSCSSSTRTGSRTRSGTPSPTSSPGCSRRVRRGPVGWGGASFARFRGEAVDLLGRRWHVLTLATLAGSLTVFLLLVLSLRAVGVSAAEVDARRGLRRLGARPHHRLDPDHTGWLRDRRARADDRARRVRGRERRASSRPCSIYRFLTVVPTLVLGGLAAVTLPSVPERGPRATERAGDRGRCAERGRVEEQSHKDEMRAALRGDFERLQRPAPSTGPRVRAC